ncbi:hypothetical protein FRB97_005089 [Tulasnella sp. 331]|nr:hypothetical protein FRB97_005089 [Tulasnella sp. 331]KAG8880328.1 hypothetical protein FRB98_005177 [Tulasnella sp. 332]
MHEHSQPSHHHDKATRGRHAHKAAAHHSKKSTSHHSSKHNAVAAPHHDGKRDNSCKCGLGWTDNDVNQKPFQKGSCWCYNWSPWPCSSVLESVPMLWSMKQIGDWNAQVKPKHHPHVLAINEPEQSGQSNMSPAAAVTIWREHVMTVSADQHGSPAVTTSPAGFTWITTFLKECTNCKIDFVCLHYYGITAADFKTQITKFYNAVRKPIWVTEWACQNYSGTDHGHQCSAAEVAEFLRETQGWMDSTPWIVRYAYYGAFQDINITPTNRLMSPNGGITALGHQYLGH